jgi:hypothetical protein
MNSLLLLAIAVDTVFCLLALLLDNKFELFGDMPESLESGK